MSTAKCIVTGCNFSAAKALKRGLCMMCHSKAKKMVESGQTTWDELVSLGLSTHNTGADKFVDAFNAAMESKDAETADRGNKRDMENS